MDPGLQMKKTSFGCPIFCLILPKNILTFLALLMKLFHMCAESVPWCQYLFSTLKLGEPQHFKGKALIFYYGNLGLGVYPWAAKHHSEYMNDKAFVLEYLIMFSKRRFHLTYSVLESPTMLLH